MRQRPGRRAADAARGRRGRLLRTGKRVEASFTPHDPYVVFLNFDTDALLEFTLELRPYRVRLCARNMDAAAGQQIVIDEDEPLVDHYCVSFWPAVEGPDEVLRRSSRVAAAKHAARGS